MEKHCLNALLTAYDLFNNTLHTYIHMLGDVIMGGITMHVKTKAIRRHALQLAGRLDCNIEYVYVV